MACMSLRALGPSRGGHLDQNPKRSSRSNADRVVICSMMATTRTSSSPGLACIRPKLAQCRTLRCTICKVSPTRNSSSACEQQAVVIGSGMAGLVAAEMLSRHFDKVLVVEKDMPKPVWNSSAADVAKDPRARLGVTQYNHVHGCPTQGLITLNNIFQGRYTPAAIEAGAHVVNLFTDFRFIHPRTGVWKPNPNTREPAMTAFATRHLFETTARKLVTENGKVEVQYGAVASGLQFNTMQDMDGSSLAVSGVHLHDGSTIPAALVVDCSGRHSNMTEWLAAAGYEKPRVAYATAGCGYASWYTWLSPEAESALGDVVGLVMMADAPERSQAYLWRVEDNMWVAAVGAYEGDYPTQQDMEHLHEYVQKVMWHPAVAKALQGSTFVCPASRFVKLSSTWRHYEESALPEGLVIIGDAVSSFSPIYGQGMTVAALEVAELDKLLTQHHLSSRSNTSTSQLPSSPQLRLQGLSSEMQSATYPIVRGAWDLAVGSDNKFPTAKCTEQRSAVEQMVDKMMQGYLETLFTLAASDSQVNEALTRVLHMVDAPSSLLQPAMLGKALLHTITSPFTSNQPKQLYQYTAQDIKNNPEALETASLQEMLLLDGSDVESSQKSQLAQHAGLNTATQSPAASAR